MNSIQLPTVIRRHSGAIAIGVATIGAAILFSTPALFADDAAPDARAERLSYVEGQVRVLEGDQVVTDNAVVNTPIFEGMQVSTGQDGRAEIQFDDGSVARLSPNTTLTLSVLRGEGSNGVAELQVNGGLAYFELQGSAQSGQITVHFGDSTVTASGNTTFRVRMDTPPGDLAVLSGDADISRGSGGLQLAMHGGESVTLYANDIARYDLYESIEPDSWDAWNTDRDAANVTESALSTGAASSVGGSESQSPAWSDLDANGNWYDVPGTGYIWSPFAASNSGFDPYGCGQYVWYPRFGYVWVSCDQWSWITNACGGWGFYDNFGWGWQPGAGGCSPWWNSNSYYPGPSFLRTPVGYKPPRRPVSPRYPVRGAPHPVIVVHRTTPSTGTPFPSRERNMPVTIAGKTVEPLRPVASSSGSTHSTATASASTSASSGTTATTSSSTAGTPGLGYTVFDGSAPSLTNGSRPSYMVFGGGGGGGGGYSSSGYRSVAGATVYRGSDGRAAPAPTHSNGGTSGGSYHPSSSGGGGSYHASSSSGGGGGGGGHVSSGGGGGGGGGGGSHK